MSIIIAEYSQLCGLYAVYYRKLKAQL